MAEKYSDFYTDESTILTLMNDGNPKQREIAVGSLYVHFYKQKSRYKEFFDLCWNVFLSDEHFGVRRNAFHVAIHFASEKQLWKIIEDVLQGRCREFNLDSYQVKGFDFERDLLWELNSRRK